MKRQDIPVRDPFILVDSQSDDYYLYGTTSEDCWSGHPGGFWAYRSKDLCEFEGPFKVFDPAPDFWADKNYWAPEVHEYQGAYYMFATFYCTDRHRRRGTQILRADSPAGPFVPHSDGPVTPPAWECLDGTFYQDSAGTPYIVYCHEWLQIEDGTICVQQLSEDLTHTVSDPVTLFHASEAPWSTGPIFEYADGHKGRAYVTDGPFLMHAPDGGLHMLWSSFEGEKYAIGVAHSDDGIYGPWHQETHSLYNQDGGHGMILTTRCGKLLLSIHGPNDTPNERSLLIPLAWEHGRLVVKN